MDSNEIIKDVKEYINRLYSEYTERGGGYNYRYVHAVRVCNMALRYVNENDVEIDSEALALSCLLHDVGKVSFTNGSEINMGLDDIHHCKEGAKKAKEILIELGVKDSELIKHVADVILNHHSINQELKIIEILQNSDDLDELGYLNVWRMFSFSSQKKRSPIDNCRYWAEQYPIAKKKVDSNFSIPFFKDLALKRLEKCNDFIKKFEEELKSQD
ncbi:MAG: HD domain-containing protein [Nanoarchaeota archaeon]|nr:HD domain-containing protein [Nanoarchaeota archaeon]MCK5629684.1 HD domain-containing protein [Nanoarchaeota archaeon]